MSKFKELYESDLKRQSGGVSRYLKKFLFLYRKAQTTKNPILKLYFHIRYKMVREKRGIEISDEVKIGKGLFIGHPWNITVNNKAVIGENCNIHKGVLIGRENRGKREGAPVIGNCVWIGINSVIVGKVHIGNDVLIAPNSYVNCDVPDHSVVFGNPCIIKHRDNATEGYINNQV